MKYLAIFPDVNGRQTKEISWRYILFHFFWLGSSFLRRWLLGAHLTDCIQNRRLIFICNQKLYIIQPRQPKRLKITQPENDEKATCNFRMMLSAKMSLKISIV